MRKHVIFLHIPKTAGTTLYGILDRYYRYSRIYSIRLAKTRIPDFEALPEATRASYDLLRGHMPFGLHTNFPGGASYFTILREPVDRITSIYYFLISNPFHYQHEIVTSKNLDLKGYVELRHTQDTDNFMVRCLSAAWYHVPYGELTEVHLERAKQNIINHFSVVGFQKHFDATLLLLQQQYKWYTPPYYVSARITQGRPKHLELDEETLAVIREHNQLDIKLYAWASERFQAQVAAQGEPFQRKLHRFQAINPYMAPFINLYWAARKISVRTMLRNMLKPFSNKRNQL